MSGSCDRVARGDATARGAKDWVRQSIVVDCAERKQEISSQVSILERRFQIRSFYLLVVPPDEAEAAMKLRGNEDWNRYTKS